MCVCVCVCVLGVGGGFPGGSVVNNLPTVQEMQVQSLDWEDPLEKEMANTPVFLPGKSYGQRSLTGYSPQSHKRIRHDLVTKQQRLLGPNIPDQCKTMSSN